MLPQPAMAVCSCRSESYRSVVAFGGKGASTDASSGLDEARCSSLVSSYNCSGSGFGTREPSAVSARTCNRNSSNSWRRSLRHTLLCPTSPVSLDGLSDTATATGILTDLRKGSRHRG